MMYEKIICRLACWMSICSILVSCSESKTKVKLDYMSVTDSVSMQTVAIDMELLMPDRLFVAGNSLVVYQPKEEEGVNRNHECTENGKENAQKTVTTVHKNQ